MSGTFSNEYDAPEKALNDRGGILVLDPRSAQLLVIGDDYDRSVRRYFLEHDLPVVDEKDFYQLFLEEQLLV